MSILPAGKQVALSSIKQLSASLPLPLCVHVLRLDTNDCCGILQECWGSSSGTVIILSADPVTMDRVSRG
jgi:hypothetical protein